MKKALSRENVLKLRECVILRLRSSRENPFPEGHYGLPRCRSTRYHVPFSASRKFHPYLGFSFSPQRPCCGARQPLRLSKQARVLPTAATRSARFICHRQRSHRSPFVFVGAPLAPSNDNLNLMTLPQERAFGCRILFYLPAMDRPSTRALGAPKAVDPMAMGKATLSATATMFFSSS